MSRPTSPRAVIAAVAVALAVLPSTASGAQPIEQFHDHFTDSYSTDLCGIAVDVRAVVTSNFTLYADDTFKNTSSIQNTITNPQNGKSVIQSSAGQVRGSAPTVDEEAGTITFVTSYKGLPEKIQTAHGRVLLRDAGVIAVADTFDLITDEFISSKPIVNNGPHPEYDSDFTLFCGVITAALS
jgi:hypothetical protein